MSGEVEVRAGVQPEPGPAVDWYGDQLGRYIWVDAVHVDRWRHSLRVDGLLKPDPDAAGIPALRRSFLASLDAVMGILEAAGARWERHPEVVMAGDVIHQADGSQGFTRMECRVELSLLVYA